MRSSLFKMSIFILGFLLFIPAAAIAQSEQTTAPNPPVAQPLIREGDFAADLTETLKLGTAMSEAEAESTLSSVGITPRNGWIADYPVTPDIIGEVQASISAAADSGKLSMGKDTAMAAFRDVIKGYNMPVRAAEGQRSGETPPATNYPESTIINNYYTNEGVPPVTYYAPPPDYAYLYTWVPYPFLWWDFWFPGFFVLVDFDIRVHGHEHGRGHGEFISNHFRDSRTGRISRIDPTNRVRGGTFAERGDMRRSSPSAQRGAQSILNKTEAYRQSRGYSRISRPSAATRSSAFERSANSRFERAASDRGFQSRSNAGQIPARSSARGGVIRGGGGRVIPGGGGEVIRGGGSGGGGGGYHGGGRSR